MPIDSHLADAEAAGATGAAEAEGAADGSAVGTTAADTLATAEAAGADPPAPASSFLGAGVEPQPITARIIALNRKNFISIISVILPQKEVS